VQCGDGNVVVLMSWCWFRYDIRAIQVWPWVWQYICREACIPKPLETPGGVLINLKKKNICDFTGR
jgi:hypothetical protein